MGACTYIVRFLDSPASLEMKLSQSVRNFERVQTVFIGSSLPAHCQVMCMLNARFFKINLSTKDFVVFLFPDTFFSYSKDFLVYLFLDNFLIQFYHSTKSLQQTKIFDENISFQSIEIQR